MKGNWSGKLKSLALNSDLNCLLGQKLGPGAFINNQLIGGAVGSACYPVIGESFFPSALHT